MSDSLNFYSETCQTMVSMVLSCARCCHRKFLLKSTRNNWINMAHICTHLYICVNVLSGVGVDVSLLCLYSFILAKTTEDGERILRVFGVCTKFRKLQTLPSFSTLFSGPTIAFVIGDYEYVGTQYPISKIKYSMVRVRAERTSKGVIDAGTHGTTHRNGDRELPLREGGGGVLHQLKL